MNPVEMLKAVLCGQDGKCCIAGSEADRKVVDEALAALDTAQPEQVNAMLVDALKALLSWVDAYAETSDAEFPDIEAKAEAALTAAQQAQLEPSYTAIHMEHCFQPPYETSCKYGDSDCPAQQAQPVCGYDDKTGNCTRVNCCKQAQPARPINCGTGHCSCIECPYEQAQPERAPLSEAQVTVLLDSYYASDFGPDELIRKVEQLHGIKQGGQQ